jgi:hypothetical protein
MICLSPVSQRPKVNRERGHHYLTSTGTSAPLQVAAPLDSVGRRSDGRDPVRLRRR